jgi:hypothetical protein
VYSDSLHGIAAIASDDIWAVGTQEGGDSSTLIEHWDGTSWMVVPSHSPPMTDGYLDAVAGAGADDVWAAGYSYGADSYDPGLLEHWDGSSWSIVDGPAGITGGYRIHALTASPAGVVAAGEHQDTTRTLAAAWNGTAWTVLATPNAGQHLNDLAGLATIPGTFGGLGGRHPRFGLPRWRPHRTFLLDGWSDGSAL